VAIELSSHALEQQRCYGLECDVAVFTNLSHDHLDYHGTLERYLDAKLRLFDGRNHPRALKRATAVVNDDDPRGPDVRRAAERGGLAVLGYGTTAGAGVTIGPITPLPRGLRFELRHEGNSVPVTLPLLGRYNAWNAAAAFGAARALGIAPALAARGLEETTGLLDASSRWTRASHSRCWWITRTRPTRSRALSRRYESTRAAACCWSSAAGAIAIGPSAR